MNKYELLYVIKANLSEEQTAQAIEKVNAYLQKNEAVVDSCENQGVKKLAYEIEKMKEGRFVLVNFSANPSIIKDATRMLIIDENIIRHMFTKLKK